MKTAGPIVRLIASVTLFCLACPLLGGCKDKEKERATLGFHAKGVRLAIKRVKGQVQRTGTSTRKERVPGDDYYSMQVATDQLSRAIGGLPARVQKKATSRVEERKAAAEKAREFFRKLRPTLESRNFDKGEMCAKLDDLEKILAEVEKP